MAVVSAGPYANSLHLAPGRQPHQHPVTPFLQTGYDTIRYDTRCYFNVRSKADMSWLNKLMSCSS